MLGELIEYGKNIREETKATLSEIKKKSQGTNSEGKEARIQINDLKHKEEINIQPKQNEEIRILWIKINWLIKKKKMQTIVTE